MRKSWLLNRILSSLAVLAAVLVLNFLLFRIMPGDAVSTIIDPNFSPEAKNRLRALYGLDKPLLEQFFHLCETNAYFQFRAFLPEQKTCMGRIVVKIAGYSCPDVELNDFFIGTGHMAWN